MTNAELVAALQRLPPEVPVLFSAEAGQVWAEVQAVDLGTRGFGIVEHAVIWLDGGI